MRELRESHRLNTKMDFKNKVVLVTGASSGIGAATARLFAARGARLALVGRNDRNLRATAAARAQPGPGDTPLALVADLATDDGCQLVATQVLQHYGRLDVLVNCAGVMAITSLETADMATFDRVFNTIVRGAFNLTRLVAPALIETKGAIVNVSSVAATLVHVGSLPYGMAKAALNHFTRLTALELAPKGVRVNTVSPGFTNTPFLQRLTGKSDEEHAEFLKAGEARVPMRRLCQPEDVAGVVVYLAGDQCGLVTGADVPVDGGVALVGLGDMLKNLNEEMRK
ncbi:3-oxoacyl-[acyl-carrier-protein] reductase FabG-like [Choristoneura fumiferana]|uniref:3-oxoacyl-[acyl-carrier-protein] reductase FabG-like n=1 Tax=Choristoneura fumiferana TaxID=7141 RepID=UPI003D156C08